jgi:hypothetical protein
VRLSHFHSFDLPRLLSLQIPVRCRSCHERDYAKLSLAWRLIWNGKTPRRLRNDGRTSVESVR